MGPLRSSQTARPLLREGVSCNFRERFAAHLEGSAVRQQGLGDGVSFLEVFVATFALFHAFHVARLPYAQASWRLLLGAGLPSGRVRGRSVFNFFMRCALFCCL